MREGGANAPPSLGLCGSSPYACLIAGVPNGPLTPFDKLRVSGLDTSPLMVSPVEPYERAVPNCHFERGAAESRNPISTAAMPTSVSRSTAHTEHDSSQLTVALDFSAPLEMT